MKIFKHDVTNPRVVELPVVQGDELIVRISNGLWYYTRGDTLIVPSYGGGAFLDLPSAVAIQGSSVTETDDIELELPLVLPGAMSGLIKHRDGVYVRQPRDPAEMAGALLNAETYQLHDVVIADADLQSAVALYVNYDGKTYAFPLSKTRRRVNRDYADFSDWSVAAFDPDVDVIGGQVTLGGVGGFSRLAANVVGEGTHATRVKQLTLKTSPGVDSEYESDQQSRAFTLAALGPGHVSEIERSKWPNLAGLQLVEGGATVLAGVNDQGYALVRGIHRVFIQHSRLLKRVTHGYVSPDSNHITSDRFDSAAQDRLVFGPQFWLHQRIHGAYVLTNSLVLSRQSDGQLLCAFDANDAVTTKLKGYSTSAIAANPSERMWPNAHVRRLLTIVAGEPVIPTTLIAFTDTARTGADAMALNRIRFIHEAPECTVDAAAAARISQLEMEVQSKEAALLDLQSALTRTTEDLSRRLAEHSQAMEAESALKEQELERAIREKNDLAAILERLQREVDGGTDVASLEAFIATVVSPTLTNVFQVHVRDGGLPEVLAHLESVISPTPDATQQDSFPGTHIDELVRLLSSAVEFVNRRVEAVSADLNVARDRIASLVEQERLVRAREEQLIERLNVQTTNMDVLVSFEQDVKAMLGLPLSSSRDDALRALSSALRDPCRTAETVARDVQRSPGLSPWWLVASAVVGAGVGFNTAVHERSKLDYALSQDSRESGNTQLNNEDDTR